MPTNEARALNCRAQVWLGVYMRTGKIISALVFGVLVAFVVFGQNFQSRVVVEKNR